MSESNDTSRPWHGKDNPMEALYDWVKTEMVGVHDKLDRVKALVTPVAPPVPPVPPGPVVPAPAVPKPAVVAPEPVSPVADPVSEEPAS